MFVYALKEHEHVEKLKNIKSVLLVPRHKSNSQASPQAWSSSETHELPDTGDIGQFSCRKTLEMFFDVLVYRLRIKKPIPPLLVSWERNYHLSRERSTNQIQIKCLNIRSPLIYIVPKSTGPQSSWMAQLRPSVFSPWLIQSHSWL